jgi:hypothetical protein
VAVTVTELDEVFVELADIELVEPVIDVVDVATELEEDSEPVELVESVELILLELLVSILEELEVFVAVSVVVELVESAVIELVESAEVELESAAVELESVEELVTVAVSVFDVLLVAVFVTDMVLKLALVVSFVEVGLEVLLLDVTVEESVVVALEELKLVEVEVVVVVAGGEKVLGIEMVAFKATDIAVAAPSNTTYWFLKRMSPYICRPPPPSDCKLP